MEHYPSIERPKYVSKEDKRFMTKISFVVVLAIYIVLTSLTIASVFFNFGNLPKTQESSNYSLVVPINRLGEITQSSRQKGGPI